jgi:hypothetical protein
MFVAEKPFQHSRARKKTPNCKLYPNLKILDLTRRLARDKYSGIFVRVISDEEKFSSILESDCDYGH